MLYKILPNSNNSCIFALWDYTKLVRTKDLENSMSTIEELQKLSEREDHVEFKKAEHNYPFAEILATEDIVY